MNRWFTNRIVAIEGTAMKRTFPACLFGGRLEELELEDARQEIAGIRRVARNMVLGARIKCRGRTSHRRHDALITQAQRIPFRLIIAGLRRSAEDAPTPFVQ